jgi:hypothetical protein
MIAYLPYFATLALEGFAGRSSAARHYVQVTDEHFSRAAWRTPGGIVSGARGNEKMQNSVDPPHETMGGAKCGALWDKFELQNAAQHPVVR